MAVRLWFPRSIVGKWTEEEIRWVQAVIDRLAGTGSSGATLRDLFEKNSLLIANAADTPVALVVPENRLIGRLTDGIEALTAQEVRDFLGLPLLTVQEDAAISESLTISNSDFEEGDLTDWDSTNGTAADNTDPVHGSTDLPDDWGTWYAHLGSTGQAQGTTSALSRTIDISNLSEDLLARIDRGEAKFTLRWDHIGNQAGIIDTYDVRMQLQDSGGSAIATTDKASTEVPQGLEADNTLGPTAGAGTRKVFIRWQADQNDSTPGTGYAVDNVELLITADQQVVPSVDTIEVDAGRLQDDGSGKVSLDLSAGIPPSLTKGDILYVDADGFLKVLSIGTNGQVLKVSSGLPSWGATGSGVWELLTTASLSADNTTTAWFTGTDTASDFRWSCIAFSQLSRDGSSGGALGLQFRGESSGSFQTSGYETVNEDANASSGGNTVTGSTSSSSIRISEATDEPTAKAAAGMIWIPYPGDTNTNRVCFWSSIIYGGGGHINHLRGAGSSESTDAIDAHRFFAAGSPAIDAAQVEVYGIRA